MKALENDLADSVTATSHRHWLLFGLGMAGLCGIASIAGLFAMLFVVVLYSAPSGSNSPTLRIGDNFIALCYRLGCRFVATPKSLGVTLLEPRLGDMASFHKPDEPNVIYVKRIVGMPGDEVRLQDEILYINGVAAPRRRIADFVDVGFDGKPQTVAQYEETLPNGVTVHVLDRETRRIFATAGPFKVPPGHYFVVGDNRDNSSDSRDPNGGVGFVPRENMVARAEWITFSTVGLDRFFVSVDLLPQWGR